MPWVVLAELGKMARDGLGLSRAPLLSREGGVMRIGWVDGLSLLAAGLVVYAWAVYPLALALLSRRARSAGPAGSAAAGARPRVAVILAAHNEERHIEDRLRNLQEADYPADRVAVYVGSDGSTDRTAEIAAAFASRGRVTVAAFPERRGKAAVLKDLAAAALGAAPRPEVLVFTDANTVFRSDALAELVCPFSDPRVGAVCGGLSLGAPDAASPEGAYWRWENRMKRMESAVDSCLGVNGAIYAMRAELFWDALPANTVVDDFVLGMKVRERGGRVVYAPRAVAEEELPERAHEWGRRVRIGAGDYQALVLCRRCLLPRFGWFAWMFWSHKVLRWFTPHLLLAMAAAAAVAWLRGRGAGGFMGKAVTALFVAMLLAAAVGRAAPGAGRLFRSCEHFVAMNAALFAGFVRFCRGGLKGHWTRTPR
jgi:cellulose synthase/poly-beta-1,6-N-acetylglucosamine synthase-like glycosyltransferase